MHAYLNQQKLFSLSSFMLERVQQPQNQANRGGGGVFFPSNSCAIRSETASKTNLQSKEWNF
jgi:hypothetical protein